MAVSLCSTANATVRVMLAVDMLLLLSSTGLLASAAAVAADTVALAPLSNCTRLARSTCYQVRGSYQHWHCGGRAACRAVVSRSALPVRSRRHRATA